MVAKLLLTRDYHPPPWSLAFELHGAIGIFLSQFAESPGSGAVAVSRF